MAIRKKHKGGRPPILERPDRLTLRLEESTVVALEELAEARNLPVTTYVRGVLEQHVRRRGPPTGSGLGVPRVRLL